MDSPAYAASARGLELLLDNMCTCPLTQCWANAGPPSTILAPYWVNVLCVYWVQSVSPDPGSSLFIPRL